MLNAQCYHIIKNISVKFSKNSLEENQSNNFLLCLTESESSEPIHLSCHLSRGTAFLTKLHVRPAKTQISLRIRAVWSESSQGTLWVAKDLKRLHTDIEDSDQPARKRRLIWVFAARTWNLVGNAVSRLIWFFLWQSHWVQNHCNN